MARLLLPLLTLALACPSAAPPDDDDATDDDDDATDDDDAADDDDATDDDDAADDDDATDEDPCAPLPAPPEDAILLTVADAAELPRIVREAAPGATLLLADGTYAFGEAQLNIRARGLTLRGASGDRDAVVIDGDYASGEVVNIGVSDVTIADLTVLRAHFHGIKVSPTGGQGDISGTVIHNVVLRDHRQQFVKINTERVGEGELYADDGVVRCSLFEMTDAGRPNIEPNPGGCYTGGVDAHRARGWRVHDNTFAGIHCTNGSVAEHAVHFWTSSRDTVVERNLVFDCARGVGFGLGDNGGAEGTPHREYGDDPYPGIGYVGHYDGIIRNNLIVGRVAAFDTGIELQHARGAKVFHNTIVTLGDDSGFYSSIDARFVNTEAEVRNNIVRRLTTRGDGVMIEGINLELTDVERLFVDAPADDFHLSGGATDAIGRGEPLGEAGGLDLDGRAHDPVAPNLGAYGGTP